MTTNFPKIRPVGAPPPAYSPEYLPDGRVWMLKDGERLRLLDGHADFAIAAKMHSAYAPLRELRDSKITLAEAPFVWRGVAPQYAPPSECSAGYMARWKWAWPPLELTVSNEYVIWRLWLVASKSNHANFIQQCDPVVSWFEGWIGAGWEDRMPMRAMRAHIDRLKVMLKATGG